MPLSYERSLSIGLSHQNLVHFPRLSHAFIVYAPITVITESASILNKRFKNKIANVIMKDQQRKFYEKVIQINQ
jgi:hypothetical protein